MSVTIGRLQVSVQVVGQRTLDAKGGTTRGEAAARKCEHERTMRQIDDERRSRVAEIMLAIGRLL